MHTYIHITRLISTVISGFALRSRIVHQPFSAAVLQQGTQPPLIYLHDLLVATDTVWGLARLGGGGG